MHPFIPPILYISCHSVSDLQQTCSTGFSILGHRRHWHTFGEDGEDVFGKGQLSGSDSVTVAALSLGLGSSLIQHKFLVLFGMNWDGIDYVYVY